MSTIKKRLVQKTAHLSEIQIQMGILCIIWQPYTMGITFRNEMVLHKGVQYAGANFPGLCPCAFLVGSWEGRGRKGDPVPYVATEAPIAFLASQITAYGL